VQPPLARFALQVLPLGLGAAAVGAGVGALVAALCKRSRVAGAIIGGCGCATVVAGLVALGLWYALSYP